MAVVGHSLGGYAALCVAGMRPTLHRAINGLVQTPWQPVWDATLEATAPQYRRRESNPQPT